MPSERSRRKQQVFIGFSFICDGLYLLFLGSRHALGPEAHGLPRPWPWLGLATLVHPFVDPTVAGDSEKVHESMQTLADTCESAWGHGGVSLLCCPKVCIEPINDALAQPVKVLAACQSADKYAAHQTMINATAVAQFLKFKRMCKLTFLKAVSNILSSNNTTLEWESTAFRETSDYVVTVTSCQDSPYLSQFRSVAACREQIDDFDSAVQVRKEMVAAFEVATG